ncbi:hypothetical protein [Microcoleus sp. EPA2]|uniref:hypothetical protein n=1 Tax=Microcoleus sp. EPA2 TaxID=2841654 RepID=UPI00312B9BE6
MRNYELSRNKDRSPFLCQIQKGEPIIHSTSDRPSCIRVNVRPSAVKKDRSPFLIIQKGDRSFYNHQERSPFLHPR